MPRISFPAALVRGVPVISAPDRLDAGNAHLLHAAMTSWAVRGYATVVVDMTKTRVCDSAAALVLRRGHRRARAEGGELRVVLPAALRLLSAGSLDRLMPRFSTVASAVAELPAVAIEPLRV